MEDEKILNGVDSSILEGHDGMRRNISKASIHSHTNPGLRRNHSSAILIGGPTVVTVAPKVTDVPSHLLKNMGHEDQENEEYCANVDDEDTKIWTNGILACVNPARCGVSCLCPCITTGMLAGRTQTANSFAAALAAFICAPFLPCMVCYLRGKTRQDNQINGSDQLEDCMCSIVCTPCAIEQALNEYSSNEK